MKGLREFALSCMLFGCATHTAATQMADTLQMLDPLVNFGGESFEFDDAQGLNPQSPVYRTPEQKQALLKALAMAQVAK